MGHGEEDDVTVGPGGGIVEVEEVALPPMLVPGDYLGQELRNLVDEELVGGGGAGHRRHDGRWAISGSTSPAVGGPPHRWNRGRTRLRLFRRTGIANGRQAHVAPSPCR